MRRARNARARHHKGSSTFHGTAPAAGRKLPGLFLLPGKLAPEQRREAAVRFGIGALDLGPRPRAHLFVLPFEDTRVRRQLPPLEREELEHAAVGRTGILSELLREEHEQALARKDRVPALELLRVASARDVRVVPPGVAEVRGVGQHALDLAAQAPVLGRDRLLERELLAAERDLVLV